MFFCIAITYIAWSCRELVWLSWSTAVVLLLVYAGCNRSLIEISEKGRTAACAALHAAGWGTAAVVQALLASGAQVDYKDVRSGEAHIGEGDCSI